MPVWCLFGACLVPVWCLFGACLVPVWCLFGACLVPVWCLFGACCLWWVCSRFLGLSPGPPSTGPPFPWNAPKCSSFSAFDERSIEVSSGLPFHHRAQFAIDVTLRSPPTSCGSAIPGAARENGAALARLAQTKSARGTVGGRQVPLGLETGGRRSSEALELVESLAAARAREAPCQTMSLWCDQWMGRVVVPRVESSPPPTVPAS